VERSGTTYRANEVPAGITVTGTAQRSAWIDHVLPPVERVRPGLWSIPTPFPNNPLRYVLTYALDYDGGVALIDTGWHCEEAWDGLLAGLGEAGWDLSDVKAVLVTHGHGDHMGLARRIRERSGAWVAMHELDSREGADANFESFLKANDEWLRHRGSSMGDAWLIERRQLETFEEFRLVPDRYLIDGDRPLGPTSDIVNLWTPGHTAGHTCFVDRAQDVVMTGDHILPRITPNISPSPGETADILGDYLKSLTRLRGLSVGEVLPAHEYRFAGLDERIDGLLEHHDIRLGEVIAVLVAQPGCSSADVAAGLRWSRSWDQMADPQRRFAIGEAYSHLVHLEADGRVVNRGSEVDQWFLPAE
jgi:glyoxylase-like metal-dependent hydrolase (beta-lactamase superfamily II)